MSTEKLSVLEELMDWADCPISEPEFTAAETRLLKFSKRRHGEVSAAVLMRLGVRIRNLESQIRELEALNKELMRQRYVRS